MALTKVTGQVIKNTTDVTVGVLTVTNTLAVGGTVSIGGTLTYEDVTNVDAVGLITARNGIVVGSGITLSKDGDVFFTGIATGNGSGLTALNASNLGSGTVPTARLGSGTASSSTFLRGDSTFAAVTSTTINSNADNRVITGSSSADTLNAESNLTYNGGTTFTQTLDDNTAYSATATPQMGFQAHNQSNTTNSFSALRLTAGSSSPATAQISSLYTGAGQNDLTFQLETSNTAFEAMRITSAGYVGIGENSPDNILHVNSGATNTAALFESTDTEVGIQLKDTTGSSVIKARNDFRFDNSTGELARIDSSGRVLIGTTTEGDSTADNLTIADSGTCGITIRSGTTSEGNIFFSDGTSGAAEYAGTIQYNHSSNYMQFATDGSERMRIVSDGRVSIGGMAPDTGVNLHIESSGETNMLLEGSASGVGGYLMLKNKNNTANSSMSIQFLDASGQGVSEINGVAMSDANNQGYLAFKTRPNGGSMTERFRVSDIGVIEKTQQSNVRTFEFAFSGGVGGSTTTQAIATLSNTAGSTMAIAHIDYVSTYGVANDYIHCGIWACSTRRKNSNTGWQAESNQVANGGSGSAGPVVCGWLNGELQFTCTAFMGYTIHVQLTVYNALTTINAL